MSYMEQQMQNYIESGLSEADRCYTKIAELEQRINQFIESISQLSNQVVDLQNARDDLERQNAGLVANNQELIDRAEKLNQKNFELTCFSVDVLRCLKTIAFEHNWSDVARYQQLAKDCMESIQNNDQLRHIQAEGGWASWVY